MRLLCFVRTMQQGWPNEKAAILASNLIGFLRLSRPGWPALHVGHRWDWRLSIPAAPRFKPLQCSRFFATLSGTSSSPWHSNERHGSGTFRPDCYRHAANKHPNTLAISRGSNTNPSGVAWRIEQGWRQSRQELDCKCGKNLASEALDRTTSADA